MNMATVKYLVTLYEKLALYSSALKKSGTPLRKNP